VDTREIRVKTPFGEPSDGIVIGTWKASEWLFWRDTAAGIAFCRVRLFSGEYLRDEAAGVERIISA